MKDEPLSARVWKFLRAAIGITAIFAILGFVFAWWWADRAMATVYAVNDPPLPLREDGAAVERGRHLYSILGCVECHGKDGAGKVFIEDAGIGRFVASNLTPGTLPANYTANALGHAIRNGVRPDGTPLRFMPVGDWNNLGDADTAALVAYLRSLPPVRNNLGAFEVGPLARVLFLLGEFHLVPAADIDHSPRRRDTPDPAPTAAYGAYLAQSCTGCHGSDFAGQRVPGTPPDMPAARNLTPHGDGLAGWNRTDFGRALRQGKSRDGRSLHPLMPYGAYSAMSDDDVTAIWTHLQSLPAKAGRPQ